MKVINITQQNYNLVRDSSKPVLIDFYADWCGPCRMVSPLIEQIAEENPQYLVCKINVDDEPELASQFGIASIPTLVAMKDGVVTSRSTGAKPMPQILALLED